MPKQLTKVMTIEAAKRAAYEAKKKGTADVEVPHFEKVLAQLVRFFEIHLKQTPLLCVCVGGGEYCCIYLSCLCILKFAHYSK